jgi:formylglycine-generating enzyme required for sulfatase activity
MKKGMRPAAKIAIAFVAATVSIFLFSQLSRIMSQTETAEEKRSVKLATTPTEGIFIKGGCFDMGDLFGDGYKEESKHHVCVDNFHLDQFEVTQKAFSKVMGGNPSDFKNCDDCPVENVTWDEAANYCEKIGKRLPTEAEWEYAAREGGKKVKYGTGTDMIDEFRANIDDKVGKTKPVGSYAPNALRLYDMTGNVWEWVADWFGENYYIQSPEKTPKGPTEGESRIIRGGSWKDKSYYARATQRDEDKPSTRDNNIGFRCAK